jgi:hypothetical protein
MCRPGAEATSAVENLLDILATGTMYSTVVVFLGLRVRRLQRSKQSRTADPLGFDYGQRPKDSLHMPVPQSVTCPGDSTLEPRRVGLKYPEIAGISGWASLITVRWSVIRCKINGRRHDSVGL